MKILKHETIHPIQVVNGDWVQLGQYDAEGNLHVVLEQAITGYHVFTEAEIVEDDTENEYKLGGFFIEKK